MTAQESRCAGRVEGRGSRGKALYRVVLCGMFLLPLGVARANPRAAEARETLHTLLETLRRQGIKVDSEALDRELKSAVVRAADPGGAVMTPAEYERLRTERQGLKRGIGLELEWVDGDLRVTGVREDSPAARAGLVPGALLDSIDGRFVTGRALDEIMRALDDGEGESVVVDALLPDEREVRRFECPRVVTQRPSVAVAEPWPHELLYVRLDGLHDDAAPVVAARLREAQEEGRFGVVLDLRGASGARVDAAAALAGLLSPRAEGASLLIEALDGSTSEEFLALDGERIRLRSIVLIDGKTTGAAELLAAILRAIGRGAMLVGEPTAGDRGLREGLPFGEGVMLYVRTRRVLVNGTDIRDVVGEKGVEPHVLVSPGVPREPASGDTGSRMWPRRREERETQAWRDRVRKDPALERAVDVLVGLQALDAPPPGEPGESEDE